MDYWGGGGGGGGGGGPKGYVGPPPPSQIIGGGGAGPLWPPSSYAYDYPIYAMQHADSCFVNFWLENENSSKMKIALTDVRSRVRESLAKRLI